MKMTKFRLFLLGILFGQLMMVPTLYKLYTTPRIEGIVVSDRFIDKTVQRDFVMQNIPSRFKLPNNTLRIHIATEQKVNEEYQKDYNDGVTVLGFYDPIYHEIWSVDSTDILVHEIRHVFEGGYHR